MPLPGSIKHLALWTVALTVLVLTVSCGSNVYSTTASPASALTTSAGTTLPVTAAPAVPATSATSHIPADTPAASKRYDDRWTFGDISVTPTLVTPGQNMLVKVYIYMPDVIETWGDVILSLNGKVLTSQHVFCYGDEVILTQFNISIATPGNHVLGVAVEMQDHPPGLISSDEVFTYITVTS